MKCPSCAADAGDANYCPDCGTDLRPIVTCPNCGKEVERRTFCAECGEDMRSLHTSKAAQVADDTIMRYVVEPVKNTIGCMASAIGVVIIVVIILVLIALGFDLLSN
jgi:uncharacterized membrane protein YvbJ